MTTELKAIKPKQAVPSKPKIAVMGAFGVGKTWALLEFPATFYCDTEGGADLPHYIERLEKAGGMYFGPDQGSQSFEEVIDQVKALAIVKHNFKTLVIDSLSKLFNDAVTKEAERLGEKDGFGASKKPALRLSARLMYWIDKVDMNVVLVAHEKAKWEDGKQSDIIPDASDKLGHDLHLLLQIKRIGDSRKAFVRKTRLLGFPDASNFEWSYEEFAKRYGKEIMESAVKTIELATAEQIAEVKSLLENIKLTDSVKDKWIAENINNLGESEKKKIDGIIIHLRAKINPPAPIDGPKPPKTKEEKVA